MTERAITLWLPWPPSSNGLFRNVGSRDGKRGGRIPTQAYMQWKQDAAVALMQQPVEAAPVPAHLHISLTPPSKRLMDCSNRAKAVEDFLVAHGILAGDDNRYVRSVTCIWAIPPAAEPGAVVTVSEAG